MFALLGVALLSASCREDRTRDTYANGGVAQAWHLVGPWLHADRSVHQRHRLAASAVGNEPRGAPGTGTFRVTLHSDVSGRSLLVAVDVRGVGRDTTYVTEDPRPFFLAVESANLDWTIEADEAVAATAPPSNRRQDSCPDRYGRVHDAIGRRESCPRSLDARPANASCRARAHADRRRLRLFQRVPTISWARADSIGGGESADRR